MAGIKSNKKDLILDLEKNGFTDLIIPMHNKDLPKGLLIKLLKQSGLNYFR